MLGNPVLINVVVSSMGSMGVSVSAHVQQQQQNPNNPQIIIGIANIKNKSKALGPFIPICSNSEKNIVILNSLVSITFCTCK